MTLTIKDFKPPYPMKTYVSPKPVAQLPVGGHISDMGGIKSSSNKIQLGTKVSF